MIVTREDGTAAARPASARRDANASSARRRLVRAFDAMRIRSICRLAAITSGLATSARAQDLPPLAGGPGGTPFAQVCPEGAVLTGIRARRHRAVVGLGVRCRRVRTDGTLGPEEEPGPVWGGGGGTAFGASCASGHVVAGQVAHLDRGRILGLAYHCYRWTTGTRRWSAAERGPDLVVLQARAPASGTSAVTRCPSGERPADGLRGRSATVVDAIGLRCDAP